MSTSQAVPSSSSTSEPYFDTTSQKWMVETNQGTELEWDQHRNQWVPLVDEDLLKKQQAAYAVQGVDESEEIVPLSKEERKQANKKRKATTSSSSSEPNSKKPRSNTAIYITSLPASTSTSLLHTIFSKAGLILEDTSGSPRIKLYTNEDGSFKGEALVVYLQKESVELAVRLFDQTELRLGSGEGLIGVQEAKWEEKKKESRDGKGEEELGGVEKKKKEERQKKMGKKAAALRQKLGDWSSEDEDESKLTSKKFKGVVVLEGMFSLKELEEDATLLLDLKEDVRDECENLGTVTNVTLYDKEDRGIMTVRFKEELSAQACIAKMSGRFFAGRTIQAYPMNSSHKFIKSGRGGDDDLLEGTGLEGDESGKGGEAEEKEKARLKAYADYLEKGGE
ncbi:hypothetical protein JCM5353_001341 [Sporobolomyces roseus]